MKSFKIIMSPSKTQQVKHLILSEDQRLKPLNKASQAMSEVLLHRLKALEPEALGKALDIKGKLLDETYLRYQSFEESPLQAAIGLYTGSVFKALTIDAYNNEQLDYMENHLRILSAFYGILRPFELIKPYRLDMTCKVFEGSSYDYWRDWMSRQFTSKDVIVNLASEEFSSLVDRPMIHVAFKERNPKGQWVVKSTYAKMARGQMIHWAVCNLIAKPEDLKRFTWEGYGFDPMLSTDQEWIFTRSV